MTLRDLAENDMAWKNGDVRSRTMHLAVHVCSKDMETLALLVAEPIDPFFITHRSLRWFLLQRLGCHQSREHV